MCQFFVGISGVIIGAIITGATAWYIAQKNSKQNYYNSLIKLFEQHNWNIINNKLEVGFDVHNVDTKISIVCYQHVNLFFYAYLNKSIIENDGTLDGLKNWARKIMDGAKKPDREEFRKCYRQILTHGDLYPKDFITWLEKKLEFSAIKFPEIAD